MKKENFKHLALGFALTATLIGVGCSRSSDPQSGGSSPDVLVVNEDSFKKEVLNADRPVLVDFWATWCGPCRMYGPVVDKVAKDYQGRLKVVRVDVDHNPNLSRDYQINAIPRSILFHNGSVLKNWVGYIDEGTLKNDLEQSLPPAQPSSSHS